jgi:hypothetical protein
MRRESSDLEGSLHLAMPAKLNLSTHTSVRIQPKPLNHGYHNFLISTHRGFLDPLRRSTVTTGRDGRRLVNGWMLCGSFTPDAA